MSDILALDPVRMMDSGRHLHSYRIALHEAGHLVTGMALGAVPYGAKIDVRDKGGQSNLLLEGDAPAFFAVMLGGLVATTMYQKDLGPYAGPDDGAEDLWTAGGDLDLLRAELAKHRPYEHEAALGKAIATAARILTKNWRLTRRLADLLHEKGAIDHADIAAKVRDCGLYVDGGDE